MKTKSEFINGSWMPLKNFIAVQLGAVVLCLAAAYSQAQTYTVLHSFSNSPGSWLGVSLLSAGTKVFGTTWNGGSSNNGAIFTIDASGSGYTELKSFTGGNDGGGPLGLVLSGMTLYGTTFYGGNSNLGTVFKVNTDGSGYTVLRSFTGYPGDGVNCNGGLLLSGSTLYGTTRYGGSYVYGGTLFKVNVDGSGYEVIRNFTGNDGAYPNEGLAMSGSTLYGTTGGGGSFDKGTIYKVNTDGSGFAVLKNFTWTDNDGYSPEAGPILSDNTLYGTTLWGGGSGLGTVYKVNTDGSDYNVLKQFVVGSDGAHPMAKLVAYGKTLFGSTWSGGINGKGILFTVDTDGSGYAVLNNFDGGNGANSMSPLVFAGTTLFGMTTYGGSFGGGVIFSLLLSPPTILMNPQTQSAETDTMVGFSSKAAGFSLNYHWVFNGNDIVGCTKSFLGLSGIQTSNIGAYVLVVSNIFGSVTSAPAMLNVIPTVPRRPVPTVTVKGETGSLFNVEYASDLNAAPDWTALGSVSLTSTSQFYFDLTTPLASQRFYRAWQTGTPSISPSLEVNFVTAITLAGNVGDSLRLDYINAIGPTNAWVTLDTVTLTNTPQLYFDVSALGQPRRLYRIVPIP
jgi:uncharacterized repeat protein (TIGR03803 family)